MRGSLQRQADEYAAAKGLSKKFVEDKSWDSLPEDVRESVFGGGVRRNTGCIKGRRPGKRSDDGQKIKSMLACPVLLRERLQARFTSTISSEAVFGAAENVSCPCYRYHRTYDSRFALLKR